ncbi:flagellar basal body rod protein FlgB [Clostridia bacterium]|nr:flagellar basal body rod protein FlgB [Clostridia bacterium]
MLSRLFNHANLMQKSLDVTWLKMEINSQNIANADTPGYDAKRVEFEDALLAAMDGSAAAKAGTAFKAKVTNPKHFDFSGEDPAVDPRKVEPRVVTDEYYVMRMDDNNVDIDKEMVDMAKNTIQYNALITKTNKEFARLKTAIKGA